MTSERGGRVIAGPGVRPFEVADHRCFACGSLNEHGIRLVLHVERGRSWTELELEPQFEGWAGIAHGGILCTILDEVMAWLQQRYGFLYLDRLAALAGAPR